MTTRDPKTKLQIALDILDHFTDTQSIESLFNHMKPQKKGMGISRIVEFTHLFMKRNRLKSTKNKLSLERALDDVKRYHPIINHSTKPEHKKLSRRALESIHRYNTLLDPPKGALKSWYNKLFFFLVKNSRSSWKNKAAIQLSHDDDQCAPALRAANIIQKALLKQEEDAFRMKAISLIQKQEVFFPSIKAALECIRNTPIYISNSTEEERVSIITLNQTLTPFPGETIVLSGAFKRNPESPMPTTPISNSFELTTSNHHTGYPYPSQHNGWILPEPMIPQQLHQIDDIPLLKTLLKKKQSIKEALHHKKSLKKHVHALINCKQKAAEKTLDTFIHMHTSLCFAMISAAPTCLIQPNTAPMIINFFEWIAKQPSPYTTLSCQWREFNERYFLYPFTTLNKCWIEQTDPKLFSNNSQLAFTTAKKILNTAKPKNTKPLPHEVEQFFSCMETILRIPTHNIFLQSFSELIEYAPPILNDFEKKLQSLALTQLQDYILELDSDLPQFPFEKLKRSLTYETEFLSNQGQYHSLVSKLEHYYAKKSREYIGL